MPQLKPTNPEKNPNKLRRLFLFFSACCLLAALGLLFLTYYPILFEEAKYITAKPKINIKPVDQEFGIVIPKINANAKVIRNVNPYVPAIYQQALSQGVAHAQGTGLPGEKANIFLFAHSSGNWYQANRFNSVFYLLYKLKNKDLIEVYFHKQKFAYQVTDKVYVDPSSVEYLSRHSLEETLTLMTCWPPGTTNKRLIVIAKRVK